MNNIKLEPFNQAAEESLLSCMIGDKEALAVSMSKIDNTAFYNNDNKTLFLDISKLTDEGKDINLSSLSDKSKNLDHLYNIVGKEIMYEKYEEFLNVVIENKKLRNIIKISRQIASDGYGKKNSSDILGYLDNSIKEIYSNNDDDKIVNLSDLFIERIETYAEISQGKKMINLKTTYLDSILNGGLKPGQLIYIGGRPGQGKSAFMLNMANQIAKHGNKVLIKSLEMSRDEIIDRDVSLNIGIPMTKMSNCTLNEEDFNKISYYEPSENIIIDDSANSTVVDIKRQLILGKYDCLFIDYLQLINPGKNFNSKNDEIEYISRHLKLLAKEFQIPVICLTQLNRGLENRNDKRPILSDLRSSGAIEQDADAVVMIYREKYYDKYAEDDIIELLIRKHRNGPIGEMYFEFIADRMALGKEVNIKEF